MPNRRSPHVPGRRPPPPGGPAPGLPPPLSPLPWELPHNFLGLDEVQGGYRDARALVLPVPYEATTSCGQGTRAGPRAILEASRYLELFDPELEWEPSGVGIHTLPAVELSRAGPGAALAELESVYGKVVEAAPHRFLVMLGGEHSISAPAIRVQARRAPGRLTVLQLDAHVDLRGEYEGTPSSHASAMRRVADEVAIVAVGVRALAREEEEFVRSREGITLIPASEFARGEGWMEAALAALGPTVYLTVDVDYFDPSLVPSTGTPEPGGGDWYGTLRFLRRVFREREVVAADVVELAPVPGLHAPDFLVAKLVYKLIGYRFAPRAG